MSLKFIIKLTAIDALLLLLGLGTWKFLPSKSALSSSSLELELSKGRIPWIEAVRLAICAWRFNLGIGIGGKVPWIDLWGNVPAIDNVGYPNTAEDGLVGAVTGSG